MMSKDDFNCFEEGISGNCNLDCPFLGSDICDIDLDELMECER